MDSILVVGADTVVGSNLAAHWTACGWNVAGLEASAIEVDFAPTALDEARRQMASVHPSILVFCSAAGESAWSSPKIDARTEAQLRIWARAARDAGCRFTYLSSDAVFTGPWLFHAEDSEQFCPSLEGARLRAMEELVERVVPEALIVRTNAFGWSPDGEGWLEALLTDLEDEVPVGDPIRHATPILATDLAGILARAHEEELSGLLHVAGAERVSQATFVRQLARQWDLPSPTIAPAGSLAAPATGFGRGETSLRTKRARNVLNLSMPMLGDGLARLHAQAHNDSREQPDVPAAELQRAA